MKRITFYSSWAEPCGIAGYTADLKNAIVDNLGYETKVERIPKKEMSEVFPSERLNILRDLALSNEGVAHIQHEFSFFGESFSESCKSFAFFLRQFKSEKTIVTFHTLPPKFRLDPRLFSQHGLLKGGAEFFRQCRNAFAWKKVTKVINANKVLCIAHNHRSAFQLRKSGISKELIIVIPLGMNRRPNVAIDMAEAKAQLGYAPTDVLVGLFGFVAGYKGPDVACEAVSLLPDNYQLVIVGGRHPENKVDNSTNIISGYIYPVQKDVDSKSELQVRPQIKLTGYLPTAEIDLYRKACDIFIAPYREVNLSSSAAVTWALSSGRPLIASAVDAFIDINKKYECMLMVGEGQTSELAWAIQKLDSDETLQNKLIDGAAKYCTDHDWAVIAEHYAKLYG
jgi:glycosyltransferase involved in cell wall biosynthesis